MFTLIAAIDRNGSIGKEGGLPWRLPSDLRRFKQKTYGLTIVMGRRTFDTIGTPLEGRRNIVLTRNKEWIVEGVETANSVDDVLKLTMNEDEVMIIGGAEIYKAFLPLASSLDLTLVDTFVPNADAKFPEYDPKEWILSREEKPEFDVGDEFNYILQLFTRINHQDIQ